MKAILYRTDKKNLAWFLVNCLVARAFNARYEEVKEPATPRQQYIVLVEMEGEKRLSVREVNHLNSFLDGCATALRYTNTLPGPTRNLFPLN
jgi:hypothetical protein